MNAFRVLALAYACCSEKEEAVPEPAEAEADPGEAAGDPPSRDERPVAKAAASTSVRIVDFDFVPKTITVDVGDTVTWTNDGPTPHSGTANDGSFDTGVMDEGQSGSHTFSEPGTIACICTPHPFMKGTVVVQGTSAGSADPGADDAPAGGDAGAAGPTADSGPRLPATGAETLLIALLGLLTLGAGMLLRRRAEA